MEGEPQNLSPWQQMRLNAMYVQQAQAQLQARRQAGQFLYDQMGQKQPAMPPPPQVAPPPGAMSPGGGNPMAQGGASVMAPPQARPQMQPGSAVPPPPMLQQGGMPPPPMAAGQPMQQPRPAAPMPMAPPQIPPFKPLPPGAAGGARPQPAQPGQVPPPPSAQAPDAQMAPQPHPLDLKGIIGGLQKSGIKPDKVMDMLDALTPAMNAQNKQELDFFKANNAALKEANAAYARVMTAMAANTRANTGVKAEERRTEQGDERNAIAREKLGRQAGGAGNIKKWEYDKADPQKVVGGWTASGKHIKLDEPGQAVAGKPGGAGGQAAAVRSNIVKSGVKNAIDRLNEIDKLGDVSTSSFFGQHGDNPLTRGAYGAAKGMQSKGQQDADAKWASMIDEAIPVFTGGLRGSDAFRRFLIEQAPGPGDKPETIREKKRLFRQNIEGTSKAFFNKYSNDPTFWGPGVTPEQAKGGAAPQQGALPGGIPAGSTVIGKTPDGRDVYKSPDGQNYTAD